MTISTIILNSSNVVKNTNNTIYSYKFPNQLELKNKQIAVHSLNMYYSWYNVNSSLYNNNFLQYQWWDSNGVLTTYDVNLSDGNYTISDLNYVLQAAMFKNGHYVQDNNQTTKNIYYIEITENITEYAAELNISPVPISLPANQIKGGNWALPTTQQTPRIIFTSSSNFKNLLGFNTGVYPPTTQSTLYRQLSQNVPMISPVSSIIIRCNACRSYLSNPFDILFSFTSGTTRYGDIIDKNPQHLVFIDVPDGSYSDITLTFVDQNFNNMHILDNQLIIQLIIMDK
jgi:hypothetical protein